jgi:hypothetical protein
LPRNKIIGQATDRVKRWLAAVTGEGRRGVPRGEETVGFVPLGLRLD